MPRIAVLAAHFDQLQEHGGEQGLIEQGSLLDAALDRARNKYAYHPESDLADLAAAYVFGIAKVSHPFLDGNKRTAFVVAVMFLILNGKTVGHAADDVAKTMFGVAEGSISESELADWFRQKLSDAGTVP